MSADNHSEFQPDPAAALGASEPVSLPELQPDAESQSAADAQSLLDPPPPSAPLPPMRPGIAPLWHTILLVVAILGFSFGSVYITSRAQSASDSGSAATHAEDSSKPSAEEKPHINRVRLIHYGLTGCLELALVAWVAFGMRLRGIPMRSLLGNLPRGLNDITMELGIAAAFWLIAFLILGAVGATWQVTAKQIYQHRLAKQEASQSSGATSGSSDSKTPAAPHLKSPAEETAEQVRQLIPLAPANGVEVAAWGLLCLLVGFSEELVFRGYLQTQSFIFLRGIPAGVIVTSLIFGAAHAYQGLRGMCIITVFGALFSCLVLLRKNLVPGMIAHSWHDFMTMMLLAFIRANPHLLDQLKSTH